MVKSAKKLRRVRPPMAKVHFSASIIYRVPQSRLRLIRDHIVRCGTKIVPERGKADLVRQLILIGEKREARLGRAQ